MTTKMTNGRSGFTLIEMMIVVAIIGILASVAIPQFVEYQLTSKRAEAFANLASLAKAQKSYFAEFGDYISAEPQPGTGNGDLPMATKRDMTPIEAEYFEIGWTPEGNVFFDYDSATPADPLNGNCVCADECFTASAYGDLDGDGLFSILIYAHPNQSGEICSTGYGGAGGPFFPPVTSGGDSLVDQAARVRLADDF